MRLRDVRVRVRRGAALLDSVRQGWRGEVSVERLEMYRGDNCVLGQLYGHYSDGKQELGLNFQEAEHMGFYSGSDWSDYTRLDKAWTEVLVKAS